MLCRNCDRGNIYCSKECSKEQRKRSLQRAGRLYQNSFAGRIAHAQRQKEYRARAEEKVTHQGSNDVPECDSLVNDDLETATPTTVRDGSWLRMEIRCHLCGEVCGSYARFEFWRGGRYYGRLKKRIGNNSRD